MRKSNAPFDHHVVSRDFGSVEMLVLFETAAGYAIFKARPATVVVKRSRVVTE